MSTLQARIKLGNTFKRLRLAYTTDSQENFAKRLKMHRTYYSAIERGEKNVTLETILRIAFELGIALQDLFEEADL